MGLSREETIEPVKTSQRVRSICLSPRGDLVAIACGRGNIHQPGYLGYQDRPGEILVYSFPDLKERWKFEAGAMGEECSFSPDGKLLVASFSGRGMVNDDANGETIVFSAADAKVLKRVESSMRTPAPFSFSANGKTLMVMDYNPDTSTGTVVRYSLPGKFDAKAIVGPKALGDSPGKVQPVWNGRRLFRYRNGVVAVDVETGETLFSKKAEIEKTTCFAINNDESLFAVGTMRPGRPPHHDPGVLIWDIIRDRPVASWTWQNAIVPITAIQFSPDGKLLVADHFLYELNGLPELRNK